MSFKIWILLIFEVRSTLTNACPSLEYKTLTRWYKLVYTTEKSSSTTVIIIRPVYTQIQIWVHFNKNVVSFPFCFILFSVKIIWKYFSQGFQKEKKGEWPILAGEMHALRIQCQDYTKCNTKSNTMAARDLTYTCATKTPELGIFWTGKQMSRKACLKLVMTIVVFPSSFVFSFHMLKILTYKICPNHMSKLVCIITHQRTIKHK